MRDGRQDSEVSAKGARRRARGFASETSDLLRGENQEIDVAALGVRVFAVSGSGIAREVHQIIPEAARTQQAAFAGLVAADAQRVARRGAAGLEDYFGAILGAECARRVGVRIFLQEFAQSGGVGFESGPPVAEGMKDNRSGAEDFLNPGEVFAGYADDHVPQLGGG